MKKGEGNIQKSITNLLRKKSYTTQALAETLGANRNYIRKVLRGLVNAGKLVATGVASPKGGLVYKRKR